jgi:hypothetical protein
MTPEEIANRWVKVQECVAALAPAGEDCADGHGGHRFHGGFGHDDGHGHRGWGHHGSTGHSAGWGGMSTFGGLHEGFHRL